MSDAHGPPVESGPRLSVQDIAEDVNRVVGARVAEKLRASGRTQLELAQALGLDQASVSRRLAGRMPWRVADVHVAAVFLGVSVADLMAPEAAAS